MYPVALSVRDRRAVVIGGGPVAERKVRGLIAAGAAVVVVSPSLTPPLAALAEVGAIGWEPRPYAPGDLAGAFLAFAAADDAVNAAVTAEARAAGILVNDAADATRGDFATPAVHRAGPLTVTVDTGGLAPAFTQRVRDELAVQLDARYARAAATLGAVREHVFAVVPEEQRVAVLRHFAERDIDDLAAMLPSAVEHEVERAVETLAGVVPATLAPLVCATRASALATTQTRLVTAALARAGIASTLLTVRTRGDALQDRPIAAIGENVFVTELELALREGRADYAVHSCKDLPSTLAPDMTLAALTAREDPRDAFCSEQWPTFAALPPGARVGTSSPRRRAQLHALRPDLEYIDLRGNVDTRLRKLREGEYDAIVLAVAGLHRLGAAATHTVPFDPDELTPAAGQGALAVETRRDDPLAVRLGTILGDPATTIAVIAERAFLRALRGGCSAPVGAYGTWADGRLRLIAALGAPDGTKVLRAARDAVVRVGDVGSAEALATGLAADLLAADGAALVGGPLAGRLVLLPRTQNRPSRIAPALREAGAEVVEANDSAGAEAALGQRTPSVILFPSSGSVGAIADYLAGLRARGARPTVAAMGTASSQTADAHGWPPDVVAPSAEVGAFVQSVMLYVLENEG